MDSPLILADVSDFLKGAGNLLLALLGFSFIIFIHELGHFLAAKWAGIRVDRFAIGFGPRICGWRKGEGFTFGKNEYTHEQVRSNGYGETDYCLKWLPLGGYVKMLGQEDVIIDEKTGAMTMSTDPRAFTNKPVGKRMVVVSAGVIFNLLLAAVLFMVVFLMGRDMPAPVIGAVLRDSPADKAGLQAGDRIVSVNGHSADSFVDLRQAEILQDRVALRIERNGKLDPKEYVATPQTIFRGIGLPTIGVDPPMTTVLNTNGLPFGDREIPKAGDKITQVNGVEVKMGHELDTAIRQSPTRVLEMRVLRPPADRSNGAPQPLTVYQQTLLEFFPAPGENEDHIATVDRKHLLGLVPRRRIGAVNPKEPAEKAGLKTGDVVVRWGTVSNPRYSELMRITRESGGREVPVVVERDGQRLDFKVTPRAPFKLFGSDPARVGVDLQGGDQGPPVVAAVEEGTPAAALAMPRGALILEMDGQPVADWFAVAQALKSAAGRTIPVKYRVGDQDTTAEMTVPSSLVNELGLSPTDFVWSINGESEVTLDDGQTARLPSSSALVAMLKKHIGQTVQVEYGGMLTADRTIKKPFMVRADNIDPWQIRIQSLLPYDVALKGEMLTVHANGNPFKAMWMGVRLTYFNIANTYLTFSQMARRNVGVENVSGPVGIFTIAMAQAEQGLPDFLWFLAFLSVNLAVINFLPMPVVDGGLMVFLILEKIRGKPLSLKTQMVSTLVGLALIVACFLFVTIQDISKFFT